MCEYIGKHAKKQHKRHPYQQMRFCPYMWNGLCGGHYYAQYFYADDENRMCAMFEIARILHQRGIRFTMAIWKDYYRIRVGRNDYEIIMGSEIDKMIDGINHKYRTENW